MVLSSLVLAACGGSQPSGTEPPAIPAAESGSLRTLASSGDGLSCAILDGAVRCWGRGFGARAVLVHGTEGAEDLALAGEGGCAALASGACACWDDPEDPHAEWLLEAEADGEASALAAQARAGEAPASPVVAEPVAGVDDAERVRLDDGAFCLLRRGGRVSCAEARGGFEPVAELAGVLDLDVLTRVGPGVCYVDAEGATWCWGLGRDGDSGGPAGWTPGSRRRLELPLATEVIVLDAMLEVVCVVSREHRLACQGDLPEPIRALTERTDVTGLLRPAIPALCVRTARAGAVCADRSAVTHPPGAAFEEIVVGRSGTAELGYGCGRRGADVLCWGDNSREGLGVGEVGEAGSSPTPRPVVMAP